MDYPKTSYQINAPQLGYFKGAGGDKVPPIPSEPTMCSRAPSGVWEFHVWKMNAKEGDKCCCGKLDYVKAHQLV